MSYPAAQPNDKTNLWGILGIVIGFICCPILGFVFGALSLQEAKKSGKSPTLAYVAFGLSALNIVIGIALVASGNYPGLR
jgi:hypothetical protein